VLFGSLIMAKELYEVGRYLFGDEDDENNKEEEEALDEKEGDT